MTDEHTGQSIYENGRFRLRTESDYAIIDELGEFPDIMINHVESDDGSESQYADRSSVLHLLNQLADTNPHEQRHYYLKYLLNKRHEDNERLRNEIEWLKKEMTKLGIDHTEEITRLARENEELKERLDYIQSSITEAINHSKTGLEQKALKKVIEDYNEYMLGHLND